MYSGQHSDGRINQMFSALERYLYDRIPYNPTTNSTVLRVDKSGDDLTAVRGEIHKPYLTIQAAVTASQSGDTILIGPGVYAEAVVIPAARTSLTIVGSGEAQTLVSPAALSAFSWTSAGAVMSNLTFRDLIIATLGGASSIAIVATAGPTSFQLGLFLENVTAAAAGGVGLALTNVNNVFIRDCQLGGATFLGVSQINAWNSLFTAAVTLTYTEGVHIPSLACQIKRFYGCRFTSTLTVTNHEKTFFDAGCLVVGDVSADLDNNAATDNTFEFHGEAQGNMTLVLDTIAVLRTVFHCQQCRLTSAAGNLNVSCAAGAARIGANFQGAVIATAAAGGIVTGARCNLNLLGATFDHTAGVLQKAGTGSSNRDLYRIRVAGYAGGGPTAWTFGAAPLGGATVPDFTDATYSVNVEMETAARDPLITAKGATGFSITTLAGACNLTVTVIFG